MLLILCITLLILSVFDKPVDKLLGRLKGVSWKDAINDSWNNIGSPAKFRVYTELP